MTTQKCKDFISSFSHIINSSEKWTRVNKYKKNQYILRDFVNKFGSTLTVAQLNNQFFFTKMNIILETSTLESTEKNIPVTKIIGKSATKQDICKFMAKCVYDDHSIVDLEDLEDAINPKSWTIWENLNGKILKDFLKESEELYLFYKNSKGQLMQMVPKEINKIFLVGLYNYDTAYRIYVFESKNHELILGCNDPD